jgi:hypothetical protein
MTTPYSDIKRPHKYKYDKCSTNFKNTCTCRMCTLLVYTIRSKNNWKLFSPNSDLSYPSHQTHLSGCMMTKRWNDHKNRNLESVSAKKLIIFNPPLFYPPLIPVTLETPTYSCPCPLCQSHGVAASSGSPTRLRDARASHAHPAYSCHFCDAPDGWPLPSSHD